MILWMEVNMKINYMFSRIDRDKGFNDNQKKYIKEDIKNNNEKIG